jgi:hypothetical protein
MKTHTTSQIFDDWIQVPETCQTIKYKPAQLYWLLKHLETEDPLRHIRTFVLTTEGSKKGKRLFERNSLRRFLKWKYEQAVSRKEEEAVAQ